VNKPEKAALLSALLFPGIGHFYLRAYLRGSLLLLIALAAATKIAQIAFQRAMAILDMLNGGEVPVDSATVAELLSQSTSGADDLTVNISALIFCACWLAGIVDSYRIGKASGPYRK